MFPAERITLLREERNMSKVQLAESVHVSRSAISEYERGKADPSYPVLIELADFFDVSIDYLLGRTNNRISIQRLDEQLKTKSGDIRLDVVMGLKPEQKAMVALLLKSYL